MPPDPVPSPSPDTRLFSVAQASVALNISKNQVGNLVRAGRLPAVRIGRRVLIARATLERVCAEGLAS